MKLHLFKIWCIMLSVLIVLPIMVCGSVVASIMMAPLRYMPGLFPMFIQFNFTHQLFKYFLFFKYLVLCLFSSIGMAKSALEAINGCNLFGEKGASWSVIYVDIDAHNRNRSIFETMLPRESSSKVFFQIWPFS